MDQPSTRFPFISLEKALVKAQQLFDGDKSGKPMAVPTAFQLWGYSPKSSGGFQTTAALKMYGLIEDEGSNADRKVKISPEARRYFLDERDDVRAGMLATFALKPTLFRHLWLADKWRDGIPADTVARSHLKLDRHLNDQSARAVLSIFKENAQFAGLKAGAIQDDPLESVDDHAHESMAPTETKVHKMEAQAIHTGAPTVSAPQLIELPPDVTTDVRLVGDRVVIAASVDLKGLRKLRRQLKMFHDMLSMKDDEDDETDPDA